LLSLALIVSIVIGGSIVAKAATTSVAPPPPAKIACVQNHRTMSWVYENVSAFMASVKGAKTADQVCQAQGGGFAVSLNLAMSGAQGQKGDKGDQGIQGVKGDTGPSGVQAIGNATGSANLGHIGGSWGSGHTVVKTVDLKAGTYHVDLTGDFYKVLSTSATPVLQIQLNGADHQLTGYTGAFPYNAAEGFGVGTDGSPNGLEQTAVATGVITLAADTTVEVDAFGYNPDRSGSGGGDFDVNATVSFIQLTPAA
jgi:hypothetical protein